MPYKRKRRSSKRRSRRRGYARRLGFVSTGGSVALAGSLSMKNATRQVAKLAKGGPVMLVGGLAAGYLAAESMPALQQEPVAGIRLSTIAGIALFLFSPHPFVTAMGIGLVLPDVVDLAGNFMPASMGSPAIEEGK